MSARFARSAQAPSGTGETQLNRSTNLPGSSGHGALLGCRRAGAAFQRSHIRSIMATSRRIPAGLEFIGRASDHKPDSRAQPFKRVVGQQCPHLQSDLLSREGATVNPTVNPGQFRSVLFAPPERQPGRCY